MKLENFYELIGLTNTDQVLKTCLKLHGASVGDISEDVIADIGTESITFNEHGIDLSFITSDDYSRHYMAPRGQGPYVLNAVYFYPAKEETPYLGPAPFSSEKIATIEDAHRVYGEPQKRVLVEGVVWWESWEKDYSIKVSYLDGVNISEIAVSFPYIKSTEDQEDSTTGSIDDLDVNRIQKILSMELVKENYLKYQEGGDNDDWFDINDYYGTPYSLYVSLEENQFRIAIESTDSVGAQNGHNDNRHYIFKIVNDSLEILFQPCEVDANGNDDLRTYSLNERPEAKEEALKLFLMVEDHLNYKNENLLDKLQNLPPDLIACTLGNLTSFDAIQAEFETTANSMGAENYKMDMVYSQLENDDRMMRSFEVCMDRSEPSMTDKDWEAIENHTSVSYFLVPKIHTDAQRVALALITAKCLLNVLEKNLASAIKIETSGICHGLEYWRNSLKTLNQAIEKRDQKTMLVTIFKLFVRKPLSSENMLYTCGMQILGQRDFVIVFDEEEGVSEEDEIASIKRFEAAFLATFNAAPAIEPMRPYLRRPSFAHEVGDIKFNPFGYTQLGQSKRKVFAGC